MRPPLEGVSAWTSSAAPGRRLGAAGVRSLRRRRSFLAAPGDAVAGGGWRWRRDPRPSIRRTVPWCLTAPKGRKAPRAARRRSSTHSRTVEALAWRSSTWPSAAPAPAPGLLPATSAQYGAVRFEPLHQNLPLVTSSCPPPPRPALRRRTGFRRCPYQTSRAASRHQVPFDVPIRRSPVRAERRMAWKLVFDVRSLSVVH